MSRAVLHHRLSAGVAQLYVRPQNMRAPSFYKAFSGIMTTKGFASTLRSHWSRPSAHGATAVLLAMRPLAHKYDLQFGVTYSRRPHPDKLTLFDCVAFGHPGGLTVTQQESLSQILDTPVSRASDPRSLAMLSELIDVTLNTLDRWEDPRRLYHDLHRGGAVSMLVDWRRLIAACKRFDRAEENNAEQVARANAR